MDRKISQIRNPNIRRSSFVATRDFTACYFLNKRLKLIRINVKAQFERCPITKSHVIFCQLVCPRTQSPWRHRESIDQSAIQLQGSRGTDAKGSNPFRKLGGETEGKASHSKVSSRVQTRLATAQARSFPVQIATPNATK
jgi:hypothetical protein